MADGEATTFRVSLSPEGTVTAKLSSPAGNVPPRRFLILAHGANNDLDFPLLAYLAAYLAQSAACSTVRFNFPYVERGVSSPDSRPVLESTFLRVYEHVRDRLAPEGAPLFVGGKSLGGRAAAELISRRPEGSGVEAAGLIELGYPLHRMGEKDRLFLEPLRHIDIPSLFCIGSHDPLCDPVLLRPVLAALVPPGELFVVEGGDHSLHLPSSRAHHPHDAYGTVSAVVADFITRVSP